MKNSFLNLMGSLAIATGLFVLTGCGDDIEMPAFDAFGDAYIRVMPNPEGQTPLYAPAYFTYGNYAIKEAFVTGANITDQIDLEDYWAGYYYYRSVPGYPEHYQPEVPQLGEISFSVVHENDTVQVKDNVSDKVLDVLTITSVERPDNEIGYSLKVNWNKVEGVEGYRVKLVEQQDDVPYFVSPVISKDKEEYEIYRSTDGWTTKAYNLEKGDHLVVIVSGFSLDERVDQGLQCETIDMKAVTW